MRKEFSVLRILSWTFSPSKLNEIEEAEWLKTCLGDSKFIAGIKALFGENKLNKSENRSEDLIALRDFRKNYPFLIADEVTAFQMHKNRFVDDFNSDMKMGLYEAVIIFGVGGSTLVLNLVAQALELNFQKVIEYLDIDNVDSFL